MCKLTTTTTTATSKQNKKQKTTMTTTTGKVIKRGMIKYSVPVFLSLALISVYTSVATFDSGVGRGAAVVPCDAPQHESSAVSAALRASKRQQQQRDLNSGRNRTADDDWPGVPAEELGHALVKKGRTFVDDSRSLFFEYMEEFLQVYKNRPDKVNLCGIRINHAFALFATTKYLKPTAIIESGVNAGQSTYFIRAAAGPDARIYAIDPLDKPICGQEKRWIDEEHPRKTEYLTGAKNFKDLDDVNWEFKIKSGEVDPKTTLVFLDDHLRVFPRLVTLLRRGFRHVLVEDNYKVSEGATKSDKAGWTPKQMLNRVDDDTTYFWHNIKSYAEFPPLVSPVLAKASDEPRKPAGGFLHHADDNTDIVAPILRADKKDLRGREDYKTYERVCDELGIDLELKDRDSYMQVMNYNQPCYFELIAMSPLLQKTERKMLKKNWEKEWDKQQQAKAKTASAVVKMG